MRCTSAALLVLLAGTASATAQIQGPSTQQLPYMVASDRSSGTRFVSIASNGNNLINATTGLVINPNETFTNLDTGVNNYRLVGIPDGMGVINNFDGTFSLYVNHETQADSGTVRAHGNRGSFVSEWRIKGNPNGALDVNNLGSAFTVQGGRDSARTYNLYNTVTQTFQSFDANSPMPRYIGSGTAASTGWNPSNANLNGIGRYCSGDLADATAYSWTDPTNGQVFGTSERLYLAGEEIGAPGRVFGHVITGQNKGQTWELPHLGDFSWENAIASPTSQRKTVVVGFDDSSPGSVYVYVGDKRTSGTEVERAGLIGGTTYGLAVTGSAQAATSPAAGPNQDLALRSVETVANGLGANSYVESAAFSLYNFGDVSRVAGSSGNTTTGSGLQQIGDRNGVTNFLRPEDGHWDPSDPSTVWFLTTSSNTAVGGNSRIYKMKFNDLANPELGGNISIAGDSFASSYAGGLTSATGTTTMEMADNMTAVKGIDGVTRLLIQEDVGNNSRLGRLWLYDTAIDALLEVGISESRLFSGTAATNPNFLTQDEETSGIIEAEFLGKGWFLLNMQAHYGIGGELVEGGQLLAVFIPQAIPAPTAGALVGLAGLAALRRRR